MTVAIGPALVNTEIHFQVYAPEAAAAGDQAVRLLRAMVADVANAFPLASDFSVDIEEPEAKKGSNGVFLVKALLQVNLDEEDNQTQWQYAAAVRRALLNGITASRARVDRGTSFVNCAGTGVREELVSGETAEMEEAEAVESYAVKVKVAGKVRDIEVPGNASLLDGCLDKGIEIKWDCKSGVCDSCTVKVVKGMENLSEATDGERNMLEGRINQGYRLSCQVSLKGPVEIEH